MGSRVSKTYAGRFTYVILLNTVHNHIHAFLGVIHEVNIMKKLIIPILRLEIEICTIKSFFSRWVFDCG